MREVGQFILVLLAETHNRVLDIFCRMHHNEGRFTDHLRVLEQGVLGMSLTDLLEQLIVIAFDLTTLIEEIKEPSWVLIHQIHYQLVIGELDLATEFA